MLTPEDWRRDPEVVDMYKRLGAGLQWWTCDCGAHWLEDHCVPECRNNHSGGFCNWPPEMLKYWDIWNWRARTEPVDYFCPLELQQVNIVWLFTLEKIDYENKIIYFKSPVKEPKS